MSLRSIITALSLSISSVALASPAAHSDLAFSVSGRLEMSPRREAPFMRDHRWRWGRSESPAFRPRWTPLGTFSTMTETMPIEFSVGGPISKLYFQQNGNKSRIRGIEIRYRDGRVGQIAIDRYLANVGQDAPVPGSRTLTLDIPNRGFVDSIVVTASNARQSSFTVFAR